MEKVERYNPDNLKSAFITHAWKTGMVWDQWTCSNVLAEWSWHCESCSLKWKEVIAGVLHLGLLEQIDRQLVKTAVFLDAVLEQLDATLNVCYAQFCGPFWCSDLWSLASNQQRNYQTFQMDSNQWKKLEQMKNQQE